ncbi:MAG: hypothetical protein Q7K45_01125, partial [Nanoarchaeota archaeon]|nr:hypothetical protein [Nanoarchaeota archaeon]
TTAGRQILEDLSKGKAISQTSTITEAGSETLRAVKTGLQPNAPAQQVFNMPRPDSSSGENLTSIASIGSEPVDIPQVQEIVTAGNPIESTLDGKPLTIPEHTRLQLDPINGGHDLISSRDGTVLLNDVHWENGELRADPGAWNPDDQITTETTTTPDIRKVVGKDGVWREMATPIDDRQYYSYDRAGSQGNELLLRDGIYENKAGEKFVVLNASEMGTGIQSGNHPNPIDVQEVIDKGQMAFAFEINGHQVIVPDIADGKIDGKLRLNPLDINPNHSFATPNGQMQLGDFSKIVVNSDVLAGLKSGTTNSEFNHFTDLFSLGHNGNNGHISAGRLIHKGGETIFQRFAAITGSGE